MSNFLNDLEDRLDDSQYAMTENGALAFATSGSKLLDFFSNGGALRSRDPASITQVFDNAYAEDALLATKALFYFRDVRGGQGERRTFRIILNHCAKNHPEVAMGNLALIPEYGRWDDLYAFVDTPLEDQIWPLIDVQLAEDMNAEKPSLLAKWLPSANASSKNTKRLARKTRNALSMTPAMYRKMLVGLRKKIKLVETTISQNEWGNVEYDKIPSKAGLQYRKAFYRHDGERYQQFLEQVDKGEKKINVGTLYPYDIVKKIIKRNYGRDINSMNTMWNNLPDYFDGNEVRGLVVADVSGSMAWADDGTPMATSVAMAIYTAEHNSGPFAGKYLTFTDKPHFITVKKNATIEEKVNQVMHTDVGYNTNVKAIFDVILDVAIKGKVSQDELPTHLYIVSDMEFDGGEFGGSNIRKTLFEEIADEYEAAGYTMPFLVFWNVNSRNDQQPMKMDHRGFQLVSGCSPSIFTSLLSNKVTSAYDLMLEVLNKERYDPIRIGD